MKNKSVLISFLIMLYSLLNLYAEPKPLVSVLPFEAVRISKQEAKVITSLFEVALVKTSGYTVIEQIELEKILEAQELSLNPCTDESCAIKIGRILSADNIFIGTVSLIGDQYIITIKLVDVSKGKIEGAESIEASSFGKISEKMFVIANNFTAKVRQQESQIQEITKKIDNLKSDYTKSKNTRRTLDIAGWTSIGIGVVAGGLSILFFILSDSSYTAYNETTSTSEALRLKSEVQLYDTLKITGLASASVCISISIPLFLIGPKPAKIEDSIEYFEEELRKINERGK
jgi:TolB-like protein